MTTILCHTDSYLKEFEAEVVGVMDNGIVLDQSAFYPGGGGQPCDVGFVEHNEQSYFVDKVISRDGLMVHCTSVDPFSVGDKIKGKIDWGRRYQLMRTHTALHILCGVVWRDYGAKVTGGDMKPLSARMDFELESMDVNFVSEIEKKINHEVSKGRPVGVSIIPREIAFGMPDLIRTKINLLPVGINEVRIVDINGLDVQADGGTHVSNTKEVGQIYITGHESKGRINKRLRISIE